MNTLELITQLRALGIRLKAVGKDIIVTAPKGALTEALRKQIGDQKAVLLPLLNQAAELAGIGADEMTPHRSTPVKEDDTHLTTAQLRMWLLIQFNPTVGIQNIPITLELDGEPDLDLLSQAFSMTIQRHDTLRTTFPVNGGRPYRRVHPEISAQIEILDLSDLSPADQHKRVQERAMEECRQLFDIEQGPLVRCLLSQLNQHRHILHITYHHLVGDRWSQDAFIRDLVQAYQHLSGADVPPLAPAQTTFSDFVSHRREWEYSPDCELQASYWREQLEGCSQTLELPFNRTRDEVATFNGSSLSINISGELERRLKKITAEQHTDLYSVLLAGYFGLLYRYSNQNDILVGTPMRADWPNREENLIGFFSNLVVMRGLVPGEQNFSSFLGEVSRMVVLARDYRNYPFERLLEDLQPERTLGISPLFQVMFVYQEALDRMSTSDFSMRPLNLDNGCVQYDLILHIEEHDDYLHGWIEYSELFSREAISYFAAHYISFLEEALDRPDQHLDCIQFLSDEDKQRLLVYWNDTKISFRDTSILIQRFEQQALRTPNSMAVIFQDQMLTYAELNQRANQFAHHLLSLDVKPDKVIAVCLNPSLGSAVTTLAILKTGAAFCYLKPTYPQARLGYIFGDSKAAAMITQKRHLQNIPKSVMDPILLDDLDLMIEQKPVHNPNVPVDPDNLAYLVYTSSYRGLPKGVMITNKAICRRLSRMQEHYRLRKTDRLLQKNPPNLNGSVWEFFLPLSFGACLVIDELDRLKSTAYLVKVIAEQQITILHFIPPMLEAFLQQPDLDRCRDLQKVICGGETLPLHVHKRFFECFDQTELYNLYGPIETSGGATNWDCSENWDDPNIPIGSPMANIQIYLLDKRLQPVPVGVRGEIYIGGGPLSRGYLNMPGRTADKFLPNPFSGSAGARLYKTGDLARYLADGKLEILGRVDYLVKIRGYRVELGEIEEVLKEQPGIDQAVAMVREDEPDERRLVAYFTTTSGRKRDVEVLRLCIQHRLPDYMIPSDIKQIEEIPTLNGRINRSALPIMNVPHTEWEAAYPRSLTEIERVIIKIWKGVLGLEKIGIHDDFFELGGNSLLLVVVYHRLPDFFKQDLSMRDLFKYRTAHEIDMFLEGEGRDIDFFLDRSEYDKQLQERRDQINQLPGRNIAVIGLAGRFPGAEGIDDFWKNLRLGNDCVTTFSLDELKGNVDPDQLEDPYYVPSKGVLDDVQGFDASFFEFTPREAQITDPQHRLFMECVWQAVENAGYAIDKYKGDFGIFGGVGPNSYLKHNLNSNPQIWQTVGDFPITIGNAGDNLCSKVAFKFNFNGPAVGIQTACSTSLMAVHLACQSLITGDCDIAVAGGVYLGDLDRVGYVHEEGMLLSPDGRCRCFDAAAKGSVPGQGVGVVVLKPLEDAVVEGDYIYAVVKGSSSSNDGAQKVGYTGYGVHGQSKALLRAQKSAEITPDGLDLIETSSTASPLGDPIEFQSLSKAFESSSRKRFCALGAVKTVVGNLDVAAGITAFIKTVLSIHHGEIPPNLHFENPNPKMDFDNSPFYVNTRLRKWQPKGRPRRAGVSAFGLGGTNAHVILEQKPEISVTTKARPWELLTISAKTPTALDVATRNLAGHLKTKPNLNISDVAYTLQVGRKDFKYRRMLVCQNRHEAVMDLENPSARRVLTNTSKEMDRPIAFMFPGQGSQYMNMGQQLYQSDLTYRAVVDECWEIIKDQFPKLYHSWSERDRGSRTEKIHQTYLTQFSVFVVEYALAQLLIKWGIKPKAMIGNSLGEYVAACLAGVFSLKDALVVVGVRGQLMQTNMPPGEMVQVNLSEQGVHEFLNERLDLAGVATPTQSMVSGHPSAIKELVTNLRARGISYRRLFSSYAFHSYMTDTILSEFTKAVSRVKLNPPKIPFISSVTGTWITDDEATDPHYWARQMRKPVRFSDGMEVLCQEPNRVFLEVGPEKTLSALANQIPAKTRNHTVLATMRHPQEEEADMQMLLTTLGRLWLRGVSFDWNAVNSDSVRNRVPLPSYPFERKPHWISARQMGVPKPIELEPDEFRNVVEEQPEERHFRPNVSTNYVEPRDAVEQTIADTWSDFLGLEEIGVHDDFFELGGSSLIAVRLINQLNKTFEVPLATHILLQKRTISTLAELIKENTVHPNKVDDSTSALVEIQHGNLNVTPMYLVHPIGGEVYFYRELAQFLGAKQPVFAFQAQSLVGKVEPYTNMEEQAAAYVEELRAVRPNPPYILGGASYGGVVAFEMARQLQAAGAEVPVVIMIDAPGPDMFQDNVTNDYAEILDYLVGDELQISLDELRELEPEEQLTYIFEKARIANRFDALPPALGIPMFKTWMGHQEALQNYKPTAYPGRAAFFRATERLKFNTTDMHKYWVDMVTGGFEIYQIPGNHLSMNFAPNVKVMTNHIKRVLKSL